VEVSGNIEGKEKKYAAHSNTNGPDRRGRSAMVGESLHSHARHDQVDPERGRRHFFSVVAPKYFWPIPFAGSHTRRNIAIFAKNSLVED
jgi:hypothetical protein